MSSLGQLKKGSLNVKSLLGKFKSPKSSLKTPKLPKLAAIKVKPLTGKSTGLAGGLKATAMKKIAMKAVKKAAKKKAVKPSMALMI